MAVEIRTFVKEIKNGLSAATCKSDIVHWLSIIQSLVCPSTPELIKKQLSLYRKLHYEDAKATQHRDALLHSTGLVHQLCQCIIRKFTVDWMTELTKEMFDQVVKPIFLEGVHQETFMSLYLTVTGIRKKDFCFHTCISLLEEMLTREKVHELLKNQSNFMDKPGCVNASSRNLDTDMLVNAFASLPAKMANKLQHENSEKFLDRNYIPLLALSVLDTLQWSHDLLTQVQDISLYMVCNLVGKLCISGYSDLFLDTMLPHLCARVRKDFIWNRICQRVFVQVPTHSLEAVILPLTKKLPWYGLMQKFIGDSVLQNVSMKTLLCTKLLLHRYYSNPRCFLQNIIGYLSSCHDGRSMFLETFTDLLDVWGNKTSMTRISTEQHLYISQALMVCIGCLSNKDLPGYKDKLLQLLMPGVQVHLESSDPQVRMVGMTVAKTLTHTLDPDGPQLEFELDKENPTVQDLLTYLELPTDPGPSDAEKKVTDQAIKSSKDSAVEEKVVTPEIDADGQKVQGDSDLDSDDDLVPYDMSNDKKVAEAKPPKYVRECMEGLICSSDNPERTELCLKHAESIIRKHTDGLEEISAEFAKILLHMSDTQSFEDFRLNRFRALVVLTVACPVPVADYLTRQFYERNYSLRQRMDILEVLASASQELSQPEQAKPIEKIQLITELLPSPELASWKEVVQRRIDSNTRKFVHGRTRPEPTPTPNRFSSVAGHFFYPLMCKVDQSEPFLDLLGQDSTLLFRLLYTLAIVLNSATNMPKVSQMGRTLLEFTWPIRLHPDLSVRQAVLIATTTVFLSVPTHYIMSELYADITETRAWLEDMIEKDVDTECQKLAAQALLILQEQVKKEFDSARS